MSEVVLNMINNDSISTKQRWKDLVQYNIFVLKFVEFGIGFFVLLLPNTLPRPQGHMYCMAAGPAVVISLIFIILYVRGKVPSFLEKMHLFFQILFTLGAFTQCFIMNMFSVWIWLSYGIFYFALLTALALDLTLIANERGCTVTCA